MRRKEIKVIAGFILFIFFSMNSFGQTGTKPSKGYGYKVARIDETKVPVEVMKIYTKEFPITSSANWYGSPLLNDQEWYDDQTYLSSSNDPENYVVEFSKDNIPHKVVYSKSGEKLAVHRKLIDNLPKEISTAILKSEYKEWRLRDKEEIFKDKDTDKLKVYKVGVEKGKEKHTLFFEKSGKLLKDKKVI